MSLVTFALKLLTLPVLFLAVLLLMAWLVITRVWMLAGGVWGAVGIPSRPGTSPRWILPTSLLVVFVAYVALVFSVEAIFGSPKVTLGTSLGGAGIAMAMTKWLADLFAPPLTKADFDRTMERLFPEPPLSQSHFDRAMAEQTKVIEEGNARVVAAIREGNAQVVSVVQEGNAQVVAALSEMTRQMSAQTQQMSELSGDIRRLLEVRSVDAGSPAPPGDADD